jgi:hypothetical protein
VAPIIRSCRIDCKLTEKQLFQPDAPCDGDGVAVSVVEEELAVQGKWRRLKCKLTYPTEEIKATAEAHEAEV